MPARILFDLKKEYYFNCFISILRALEGDDRFEVAFHVGANDERLWGILPVYHRRRIERWLTAAGYTITRDTSGFDAVVAGDALKDPERYGGAKLFVSDHGPGTKTLRARNVVRQQGTRYTVFVEGQYWMDVVKRLGYESQADWVMSGVPKLDTLFWPGYYDREKTLRALGLDPSRKTILYAPSYRPSCIPFLGTAVERIADRCNLIIKLHPYSWGGKYASASQSAIYQKLARRRPEIALVPKADYDFHPYMFASDSVISDTSSALAICLALGKVGIVADFAYPRMKHSDGMPIVSDEPHDYLRDVFVHFDQVEGLMDAVERALNPDNSHTARLMDYRGYYFTGLDGRSGERARDCIAAQLRV